MNKALGSILWACVLCLMTGGAYGQALPFSGLPDRSTVPGAGVPIEVNADSMQYDRAQELIVADGNVLIVSGADRLRADRVLVNVETGDVYATGNVVLERGSEVLRGERMHYNTQTRASSLDAPEIESDPFLVVGERIQRGADNTLILERARVTTCELGHDHAHYHVRARRLTVYPGDHIRANHAVWYIGRVPIFYVPHWRRRLHDEYGWNLYPGYRSRWGGYLLTSYFHRVTPHLRLEHHVDVYSERGIGLGEDVDWRFQGGHGQLSLYYLQDRKPLGRTPPEPPPDVDRSRYRIYLRHDQQMNPSTRLLLRNEYVSDITLRRDFFDRQYRRLRQPENFVSLSHQQDYFTITALANYRLNPFYGNVNRLPEVSLNWYRMQLGDTSVYYQSQSSLAFLERVFPRGDERDAHSTLRLDTLHSVFQPRHFDGWLHVVPRASYRATYYSNSSRTESIDVVSTRTITNDVTMAVETLSETNAVTQVSEGSMQLRQVIELGSELSFKAFRRLPDAPGGQPWRHVVEPYLNYSLRFRPTVRPDALYQYDDVDRIDKLHQVHLGVRNLLQTKRNGRSVEAADVNIFSTVNLDTDRGERVFSTVGMVSRFRPAPWMQIDTDGVYRLQASELETFNTRFSLWQDDDWRLGVEHRFRNERSNLLIFDTTFAPNPEWNINVFTRYEFEFSRLEEQGGYIQRNFDCMSIRLGGSVLPSYTRTDGTREEADYRVLLAFWLTAFPEMAARGQGR